MTTNDMNDTLCIPCAESDDEYPTNVELQRLEMWGDPSDPNLTSPCDVNGAIDFMRSCWWMSSWGISEEFTQEERAVYHLSDDKRYVKMSTGGWSGNEQLMQAFRARWWRGLAIVVTRRGGHYVLEYA